CRRPPFTPSPLLTESRQRTAHVSAIRSKLASGVNFNAKLQLVLKSRSPALSPCEKQTVKTPRRHLPLRGFVYVAYFLFMLTRKIYKCYAAESPAVAPTTCASRRPAAGFR